MNKILLALAIAVPALFLSEVASAADVAFYTPNGDAAYEVSCKRTQSKCWKKLSKICNGGYNIVSEEEKMGGIFAAIIPGPIKWHVLVASCQNG